MLRGGKWCRFWAISNIPKRLTHISTWREKSCKIEQNTKKVSSSIVYCTSYCVCDSSYTVLPCKFLSSVQYTSVQYMFLFLRFGH